MRLLFITGSLAAGRDGVADYTLRLADALRDRGADVRLLSWNEASLVGAQTTSTTLRLPASLPLRAKLAHARHFLSAFTPQVVSLQFVPYAFNARGLPSDLARELSPLLQGIPLHVFIHELWVFSCMGSSLKNRIIGSLLQKPLIIKTLRGLSPRLIHTSTPLYRDALLKENFPVGSLLPLPGNIPFVPLPTPIVPFGERPTRQLGFFGNIFASAPLEHFFEYLVHLQATTGLKLTVTSAGNLPHAALQRWQALTRKFRGRLNIERLGHLTPREAGYYLQSLDFLLSAYSPTFWQKSGTIAAAREFGKPVILLAPPEVSSDEKLPVCVFNDLSAATLVSPPLLEAFTPLQTLSEKLFSDLNSLIKS